MRVLKPELKIYLSSQQFIHSNKIHIFRYVFIVPLKKYNVIKFSCFSFLILVGKLLASTASLLPSKFSISHYKQSLKFFIRALRSLLFAKITQVKHLKFKNKHSLNY